MLSDEQMNALYTEASNAEQPVAAAGLTGLMDGIRRGHRAGLRAVEAAVRADQEEDLEVAAQAVIEEVRKFVADANEVAGVLPIDQIDLAWRRGIGHILSQSPAGTLRERDRQVAAKALTDAAADIHARGDVGEEDGPTIERYLTVRAQNLHANDFLPDHEHNPRQHRDGKPPWCRVCGLTAEGLKPVSRFDAKA